MAIIISTNQATAANMNTSEGRRKGYSAPNGGCDENCIPFHREHKHTFLKTVGAAALMIVGGLGLHHFVVGPHLGKEFARAMEKNDKIGHKLATLKPHKEEALKKAMADSKGDNAFQSAWKSVKNGVRGIHYHALKHYVPDAKYEKHLEIYSNHHLDLAEAHGKKLFQKRSAQSTAQTEAKAEAEAHDAAASTHLDPDTGMPKGAAKKKAEGDAAKGAGAGGDAPATKASSKPGTGDAEGFDVVNHKK